MLELWLSPSLLNMQATMPPCGQLHVLRKRKSSVSLQVGTRLHSLQFELRHCKDWFVCLHPSAGSTNSIWAAQFVALHLGSCCVFERICLF